MSKYKIDIIMDKPEISIDFKIICWSEEFEGKKKDAIKRAKEIKSILATDEDFHKAIFKIRKQKYNN